MAAVAVCMRRLFPTAGHAARCKVLAVMPGDDNQESGIREELYKCAES